MNRLHRICTVKLLHDDMHTYIIFRHGRMYKLNGDFETIESIVFKSSLNIDKLQSLSPELIPNDIHIDRTDMKISRINLMYDPYNDRYFCVDSS